MSTPSGFAVQILPQVWSQLSVLPIELFRTLIRDLDALAAGLGPGQNTNEHQLRVGDHVAICRVDAPARMITLVAVNRTESAAPQGEDKRPD